MEWKIGGKSESCSIVLMRDLNCASVTGNLNRFENKTAHTLNTASLHCVSVSGVLKKTNDWQSLD